MPVGIFVIAVVVGAAPLVAWGLHGSKAAWAFLAVLLLMAGTSAAVLYSIGRLTIEPGAVGLLQIAGVALLATGFLIATITGHEHHRRSGSGPLTPTFQPMDPDLMHKSHYGCGFGVAGGVLLLLSWLLGKVP